MKDPSFIKMNMSARGSVEKDLILFFKKSVCCFFKKKELACILFLFWRRRV